MRPYADHAANFNSDDLDILGCIIHGRPGSAANLPGKGGDIHAVLRNADARRRIRTSLNKRARTSLKRDLASRADEF